MLNNRIILNQIINKPMWDEISIDLLDSNNLSKKFLLDLLPYTPDVKIFDNDLKYRLLSIISFVLHELIESIEDFYFKNDWSAFDPHVGENLCQIRACQLLDIYFHIKDDPEVKAKMLAEIKSYKEKCDSVEEFLKKENYISKSSDIETVQNFLDKLKLNFTISYTVYFLCLSHFLTKFRTFNELENTIIDYPKLLSNLKVSKNIGRRMIHEYQKQLSDYSYDYVEKSALLKGENFNLLKALKKIDDDGRSTLPCYIVMNVLLDNLKSRKNNILFVVRHEKNIKKRFTTLLYIYNEIAKCYIFCAKPTEKFLKEPCFIIHGIQDGFTVNTDNYILKFNDVAIETIIMGNMATHPQYSGKKLAALKCNPFNPIIISSKNHDLLDASVKMEEQFLLMKSIGTEIGCDAKNPSLLHIRHIFCNRLDRELWRIANLHFYNSPSLESV